MLCMNLYQRLHMDNMYGLPVLPALLPHGFSFTCCSVSDLAIHDGHLLSLGRT